MQQPADLIIKQKNYTSNSAFTHKKSIRIYYSHTALQICNSQPALGGVWLGRASVHAVVRQAGVECADGVTVRVGMAEENF